MVFAATTSAIGLALLLIAEWRGHSILRVVAKISAASGFVWGGCLVATVHGWGAFECLLAGLWLSFLGDVCLLWRRTAPFLFGIGAFLLAHVVYSAAFLQMPGSVSALVWAGAIVVVAGGLAWRWLGPALHGPMRAAVAAYLLAIGVMVALAVSASARTGNPFWGLGAVCFALSDLSVARDRFVVRDRINLMWGPPLYFGSQWLLILGMWVD